MLEVEDLLAKFWVLFIKIDKSKAEPGSRLRMSRRRLSRIVKLLSMKVDSTFNEGLLWILEKW
jgi:hypothetical protein